MTRAKSINVREEMLNIQLDNSQRVTESRFIQYIEMK